MKSVSEEEVVRVPRARRRLDKSRAYRPEEDRLLQHVRARKQAEEDLSYLKKLYRKLAKQFWKATLRHERLRAAYRKEWRACKEERERGRHLEQIAMDALKERDRMRDERDAVVRKSGDLQTHLEQELAVRVGDAEEQADKRAKKAEKRAQAAEGRLSKVSGFRGFAAMEEAATVVPKWERRYAALEKQNRHLATLVEERDRLLKRLAGRGTGVSDVLRAVAGEAHAALLRESDELRNRAEDLDALLRVSQPEDDGNER